MTSVNGSSRRPVQPQDVQTQHLAFLLERITAHSRHDLTHLAAQWNQLLPPGVRPSHLRLLSLVPADGARVSDLTDLAGMTKQAVGQFMDALQELGYVRSRPDPRDRRARVVVRTAKGQRTVDAVDQLWADVEARWETQVGPRRWKAFRAVLVELALDWEPAAGPS